MMKETVYWIVEDKYEVPNDDRFINDMYFYGDDYEKTPEDCLSMVLETIAKTKNTVRKVIVTDVLGSCRTKISRFFLTNNIIDITPGFYNRDKMKKSIMWILSDFGRETAYSESNIFFISDTHFSHQNIIKYCNRPWNSGFDSNGDVVIRESDVERMNEDIICKWNSVVRSDDLVYHLGDFMLGKNLRNNISEIVSKLNGRKMLIMGNHDKLKIEDYYRAGFERVYDKPIVIRDFIVLSHNPMEFVKEPFFNIYGHVHDCETYKTFSRNSCCVCVERHDYKPISLKDIMTECGLNEV